MIEFPKDEHEQNQWYLRLIVKTVNEALDDPDPDAKLRALVIIRDYLTYLVDYED